MPKLFFSFFLILLIGSLITQSSSASNFDNQQFLDENNDQIYTESLENKGCELTLKAISMSPDIIGSSFNSNGKLLNSTIWLKEPHLLNLSTILGKTVPIYPIIGYKEPYNLSMIVDLHNNDNSNAHNITKNDVRIDFVINDISNNDLFKTFVATFSDDKKLFEEFYSSDNKTLVAFTLQYINAMLNMNSTSFNNTYSFYDLNRNTSLIEIQDMVDHIDMQYSILIDVISVYDNKVDYRVSLKWENSTRNWIEQIEEVFIHSDDAKYRLIKNIHDSESLRALRQMNESDHHKFSIELKNLNHPVEYTIHSQLYIRIMTSNYTADCSSEDITGKVSIPIPKINLTFIPNSITLNPNQKGEIMVIAESSTNLNTQIYFEDKDYDNFKLHFIPGKIFLPSKGISSSILQIEALGTNEGDIVDIPATINFPQNFTKVGYNNSKITDTFSNITIHHYPQIIIEEPKPLLDQIGELFTAANSSVQTFAATITAVGGIVTVFGALIAMILRKRKNKSDLASHPKKGSPL